MTVRCLGATALLALAAPMAAQERAPSPPPLRPPTSETSSRSIEGTYGSAEPEELQRVAYDGDRFERRSVRVRGILGNLVAGQYLSLNDGPARVMLIPMDPTEVADFLTLLGSDVEVTGVVRVLRARQEQVICRGRLMLEAVCADPDLPVPPITQANWPRVSITVIRLVDPGTGPASGGPRRPADAGIEAAAEGAPVTAAGRFRGGNLCRDLPEPERRDARDWILLTVEGPVWVTGRPPAGRGFRLDPAYRGDVNRWLEVTGRVAVADGVRFIRAAKVTLIARPPEAGPAPCPP